MARHATLVDRIETGDSVGADLNGLKMRVPNVPLFVDVWKAMGANPEPMAFFEMFTSLRNGTIEVQENLLALIPSASFYEG
ncbi:MAG: hypothetical protein ACP5EN_03660 [Rhodovulum sp.]